MQWVFLFQNYPENLDPPYKMELDFIGYFRRKIKNIL